MAGAVKATGTHVTVPREMFTFLVGAFKSEMEGSAAWPAFLEKWGKVLRRLGFRWVLVDTVCVEWREPCVK